jgi:hypothetical protein
MYMKLSLVCLQCCMLLLRMESATRVSILALRHDCRLLYSRTSAASSEWTASLTLRGVRRCSTGYIAESDNVNELGKIT